MRVVFTRTGYGFSADGLAQSITCVDLGRGRDAFWQMVERLRADGRLPDETIMLILDDPAQHTAVVRDLGVGRANIAFGSLLMWLPEGVDSGEVLEAVAAAAERELQIELNFGMMDSQEYRILKALIEQAMA